MENTTTRTHSEDPQYFGAYLNMARHNMFMLINHLTRTFKDFKFEPIHDDKDINNGNHFLSKIFDNSGNLNDEDKWRVFNYLENRHHLPILRYYKDKFGENQEELFKAVSNFLNYAFNELVNFRNSYTHYLAIDDKGNELDRKIDLDSHIKEDIEELFKKAPSFSFLRNFATQTEEDYSHLSLYKLFEENSNNLSQQGLYFFICLFLERQYSIKFLKRFTGFKNETTPPFKATLKAFTAYAIKLPSEKIKNENPKQSLLMEMLIELNKCPKELFKHLTDEDKKEFEPKLKDELAKSNIVLNSIDYEALQDTDIEDAIRELISLKRHEDRFPYFALRYIEELNIFKNIRFQITLGKLTIKQYSKEIISEVQNRRVNEIINAFGKLSDFDDKEKALEILKDGPNKDIEFEQYAPHYNMNNNKIGFYLFDEKDNKVKYPLLKSNDNSNQPTGFISIHDLPKLVLLEILAKGQAERLITEFITGTNNKIFDKALLDEIKKAVAYEPPDFTRRIMNDSKRFIGKELKIENTKRKEYIDFLDDRRKILEAELIKHDLTANQLPSKILDYLMNISEPNHDKVIHNHIRQLNNEINKSLSKLKKQQETGEKPKLGELATFITRDMINMVIDKETKDKITAPYFNKLQNKIAFFSLNNADIIELAEELNLFDKDKGHVFLTKALIQKENGVIDFYRSYLDAKSKWLNNNLKKGVNKGYFLPENKKLPYTFEKLRKYKTNFELDGWIKNKTKLPVNLPISLFDDLITLTLFKNFQKKKITTNDKTGISNNLSLLLNDDSQPFYQYKRRYGNKEKGTEVMFNINNLNSKEINKKYGGNAESNEKLVRFYQTKDRIMRLMCEVIIKEDKSFGLKESAVLLKNIYPKSDFNPLDTPVVFSRPIERENVKITAKDTDEWKKKVEEWIKLPKKEKESKPESKIWFAWTIKDFGRFNKILNDRRLGGLLQYLDANEIPFSLLEYELMEYDRIREKIFDNIFSIEKTICEKDLKGVSDLELSNIERAFNEVQFDIYLNWIANNKINFDEDSIKLIKSVRNNFSHSKFPEIMFTGIQKKSKEEILDFEQNNQEPEYKGKKYISISQEIFEKYNTEIEKVLEKISNL